MKIKMLLRFSILLLLASTVAGCSKIRSSVQNNTNSSEMSTTTETYTSVQKVREAASDQEAVTITTSEVEDAVRQADTVENAKDLEATDVEL